MQLEIFADTVCPWCYIGQRRLARALAARPLPNLKLRWRAFQLNPTMPAEGMDREKYMLAKFGGSDRAKRLHDMVVKIGRAEGIEFAFERIRRTPNTLASHRLLAEAAAQGLQEEMLTRVFEAYFTEGLDIGDADELLALAEDVGLDLAPARKAIAGNDEIDRMLNEDFQARRTGITGVPYFVFNQRFGLSGAQDPEALYALFDLAREDDALHPAS
jgi:predicted DsbA family dithiol-disulfide isomerase